MPSGVYKRTPENNAKMSLALTGKTLSAATKKKISDAKRGKTRPPFSEEWRKKLSAASKRKGTNKGHALGKKHSWETRRKMSEVQLGLFGSDWPGFVTPLMQQIRNLIEYKRWRKANYERDDYTCQWPGCGKRGGRLNVDHNPKSFRDIFYEHKITSLEQALSCKEFWDIANGRTLCANCHKMTDSYGNKAKKQYGACKHGN